VRLNGLHLRANRADSRLYWAFDSNFGDWKLDAALGSCLVLGLRHGFDYDHLAAISDITAHAAQLAQRLRLGMTYALGHAFTVAALGIAVLQLHLGLPEGLDH